MKKNVVIIGAGPAGLTAGYELLKNSIDYNVTILEASEDIGGISKTVNYSGNRMDIGGHRFFSKNGRVMDFWKNMFPVQGADSFDDKLLNKKKTLSKGGPDPEKEDKVFLVRNRVSRIFCFNKFFDYPISLKFQTFKNMGVVRTISSGFSYVFSLVFKKNEDSLENFYINRFGKKLYKMFFEKYTEKLWGRSPKDIDASWGAQRVKGISIIEVIRNSFGKIFGIKSKETSLIEEFYYPKYGPGQLWEETASQIEKMGGVILKNHEVVKVKVTKDRIKYLIVKAGNSLKRIDGDIFISSMPLSELVLDMEGINISNKVINTAKGLPFVDFQTVGVLVNKMKITNKTKISTLNNIVPDCWIYVQDPSVKMLRLQLFNNWSPYLVKDIDKIWIGIEYTCKENDSYWNMSDDEFIQFAINELVSIGIIESEDVIDSHREKIKKAYPAYFDTYKDIDCIIKFVNKFNNLYCVGRNGQHRYNNMDHSMLTAMETVDNIINKRADKTNIWKVNTEVEYHEEVKN